MAKGDRAKKPPKKGMRRFTVTMTAEMTLDVSQELLDEVLTDEWRAQMYQLHTPEEVAHHLAFNLIQGRSFQSLDGFAMLPDNAVEEVSSELFDEEVEEIKPEPKPKPKKSKRKR